MDNRTSQFLSQSDRSQYNNFNTNMFNTNTSHPLIPSSQEYMFYKKYVSIHSEDRNFLRYPNTIMYFKINNPYNPNINGVSIPLLQKIFECLFLSQTENYSIRISNGFYNPQQMVTELTNKFNTFVTDKLTAYFTAKSTDSSLTPAQQAEYITALSDLNAAGGYSNFVIVYNNVSQKIWFGNICDGFILNNETLLGEEYIADTLNCQRK